MDPYNQRTWAKCKSIRWTGRLARWLQSEDEVPRFGTEKSGPKPAFPADERDQTPAVVDVLLAALFRLGLVTS